MEVHNVPTKCSFCNEQSISPVAGPGVVICRPCVVFWTEISSDSPKSGKQRQSLFNSSVVCNFCMKKSSPETLHFRRNGVCICDKCIELCISTYESPELYNVPSKGSKGVIIDL
jgi:ATP-dependent protease Clp ATPase subunit